MSHRLALLLLAGPAILVAVPVPATTTPPRPERFHEAIGEVLDGGRPLDSVRIAIAWNGKGGHERHTLHGDGVAFFSLAPERDARQVHLKPEEVRRALRLLRDAEFGRLPAVVNEGPDKPWLTPPHGEISVRIQGVEVCKYQAPQRDSAPAFVRLAEQLLAVGNEPGREAVRAASVSDGLGKIVRGTLSPRALSLRVGWQSPWAESCTLWLDGERVECWVQPAEAPATPSQTLLLSDRDLLALARTLHENRLGAMPVGVRSELPCDVEVVVLGQGHHLSGEPRGRNTGNAAPRIAGVLTHLDVLARRTLKEGR